MQLKAENRKHRPFGKVSPPRTSSLPTLKYKRPELCIYSYELFIKVILN
jgi:hypothetical protein